MAVTEAVRETVQETVQGVTGAAQHALGEAKALLPQKELPCKCESNYDPCQLHMLRSGQKYFVICLVAEYVFNTWLTKLVFSCPRIARRNVQSAVTPPVSRQLRSSFDTP